MKIQESIVVEGRHDQAALMRTIEANIIITHGNRLSKKTLELLIQIQKETGLIIFTDPDQPGKQLRAKISAAIPEAAHAYLPQAQARAKGKVGIEHATDLDLQSALSHLVHPRQLTSDLSMSDLVELGLSGHQQAQLKRDQLCLRLHLQEGNAKHFLKQCHSLGIHRKQIETL